MADFLPRRDNLFRFFCANYATKIVADPQGYGLSVEQATTYSALQIAFEVAYRAAVEPATRGVRTVLIKDTKRAELEQMTRVLSRIVRAWPGIDEVKLSELGLLRARSTKGAAMPDAAGASGGMVVRLANGLLRNGPRVQVRADSRLVEVEVRTHEGRKRRPSGAVGAAVYWAVGEQAPTRVEGYRIAGNTTKPSMRFVLPIDVAEPGTKFWVTARWLDARLQPGPAGVPAMAWVGYGVLLAA